jgi:hypothetical protein
MIDRNAQDLAVHRRQRLAEDARTGHDTFDLTPEQAWLNQDDANASREANQPLRDKALARRAALNTPW